MFLKDKLIYTPILDTLTLKDSSTMVNNIKEWISLVKLKNIFYYF